MAKDAFTKDSLKKLLESAKQFSPEAEKLIAEVIASGRKSAEKFAVCAPRTMSKQIEQLGQRVEEMENQLAQLKRELEAKAAVPDAVVLPKKRKPATKAPRKPTV